MATILRSGAAWAPPLLWAALIFVFSAQPDLRFVPDEGLDFVVRKAGHMAVFGILALLLWRALATSTPVARPAAWAIALAILYAITDEFHQGAVSGRHPSAVDVGIDAVGAIVAIVVASLVQARKTRRSDE